MKIIPRTEWGAKPWRNQPATVPASARRYFLVHYHGGVPSASTGNAVPRDVEVIHRANGWSGIGYNFAVDQAGAIYEGRGWDLAGAHSPPHNTDGIGVYVAIGGDQRPTPAALASVRWLYDEACRRSGRTLTPWWHGRDYPTSCPGPHLTAWVKAGMPTQTTPTAQKDVLDMTPDELRKIVREEIARVPAAVWAHKIPVSEGVRDVTGTRLTTISAAGAQQYSLVSLAMDPKTHAAAQSILDAIEQP